MIHLGSFLYFRKKIDIIIKAIKHQPQLMWNHRLVPSHQLYGGKIRCLDESWKAICLFFVFFKGIICNTEADPRFAETSAPCQGTGATNRPRRFEAHFPSRRKRGNTHGWALSQIFSRLRVKRSQSHTAQQENTATSQTAQLALLMARVQWILLLADRQTGESAES